VTRDNDALRATQVCARNDGVSFSGHQQMITAANGTLNGVSERGFTT
jgi:hypothetical protein